jgi:hypothetical protein
MLRVIFDLLVTIVHLPSDRTKEDDDDDDDDVEQVDPGNSRLAGTGMGMNLKFVSPRSKDTQVYDWLKCEEHDLL